MKLPTLRLRPIRRSDARALFRSVTHPRVARQMPSFRLPMSFEAELAWLESMLKSPNDKVFAIETSRGRYVGCLGLHDIDWVDRHCEFGLVIANPQEWGRGYAAQAVRLGIHLAFSKLNLHRLEVKLLERHRIARSLYERLGFFPEARLRGRRFMEGCYEDVIVLSLLSDEI